MTDAINPPQIQNLIFSNLNFFKQFNEEKTGPVVNCKEWLVRHTNWKLGCCITCARNPIYVMTPKKEFYSPERKAQHLPKIPICFMCYVNKCPVQDYANVIRLTINKVLLMVFATDNDFPTQIKVTTQQLPKTDSDHLEIIEETLDCHLPTTFDHSVDYKNSLIPGFCAMNFKAQMFGITHRVDPTTNGIIEDCTNKMKETIDNLSTTFDTGVDKATYSIEHMTQTISDSAALFTAQLEKIFDMLPNIATDVVNEIMQYAEKAISLCLALYLMYKTNDYTMRAGIALTWCTATGLTRSAISTIMNLFRHMVPVYSTIKEPTTYSEFKAQNDKTENVFMGMCRVMASLFRSTDTFESRLNVTRAKNFSVYTHAIRDVTVFFKLIQDAVGFVISTIYGTPFGTQAEIDAIYKEMAQWESNVHQYLPQDLATRIWSDTQTCDAVEQYYKEALIIREKMIALNLTGSTNTSFMTTFQSLEKYYAMLIQKKRSNGGRSAPLAIYLYGKPGRGKSALSMLLARDLFTAMNPSTKFNIDNHTFTRNSDSEYWDGYRGQYVTFMDDCFMIDDQEKRSLMASDMIHMFNVQTHMLNMAELEKKSCTFFQSQVIIVTGNDPGLPSNVRLQDNDAWYRRFAMMVEIDVPDKVKNEAGYATAELIDQHYTNTRDMYNIKVFKQFGANKSQIINYKEFFLRCYDYLKSAEAGENNVWTRILEEDYDVTKMFNEPRIETLGPLDEPNPFVQHQVSGILSQRNRPRRRFQNYSIEEETEEIAVAQAGSRTVAFNRRWTKAKLQSMDPKVKKTIITQDANGNIVEILPQSETPLMTYMKNFSTHHASKIYERLRAGGKLLDWDALSNGCLTKCAQAREFVAQMASIGTRTFKSLKDYTLEFVNAAKAKPIYQAGLAIGTVIGIIGGAFMFFGEKASQFTTQAPQPSGDESTKRMRVKKATLIKSERGKSYKLSDFVAQAGDKNALTMSQSLTNNIGKVYFCNATGGDAECWVHILMVKDTVGITVAHFLLAMGESTHIKIVTTRGTYITSLEDIDVSPVGDDVVMLKFNNKKMPKFADITHHFIKESYLTADLSQVGRVESTESGFLNMIGRGKLEKGMSYIEEDTQTTFKIGRHLKVELPNESGICGTPYVVHCPGIPNKLLGIHVAGNSRTSVCHLITKEDLFPEFTAQARTPFKIPAFLKDLGTMPNAPRTADKTEILPSAIQGDWKTPTTMPAMLKPTIIDGELVRPAENCLNKFEKKEVTLTEEQQKVFDEIVEFMVPRLPNSVKMRKLTDFEAINGVAGWKHTSKIHMNTSKGIYRLHERTIGGKKAYFDNKGTELHPKFYMKAVLQADLVEYIEHAKQGIRDVIIWQDCLKDERRPIAKVKMGKTRLFSAAPLHHFLACRKFQQAFVENMMSAPADSWSALGINPHSLDWKKLHDRLMRFGPETRLLPGDFGDFDASIVQVLNELARRVIRKYTELHNDTESPLGFTEEDFDIIEILNENTYDAEHVLLGHKYKTPQKGSNPSGDLKTTVYNIIVNILAHFYCAIMEARKLNIPGKHGLFGPADYVDKFELSVYGDDHVEATLEKWYTMKAKSEWMWTIGLKYTDQNKTKNFEKESYSIGEVSYLKRSFRKESGMIFAPLDMKVIDEIPNWIRGCNDYYDATTENANAALREMFHYGRFAYNEYRRELDAVLVRNHCQPTDCPTWDQLYADFVNLGIDYKENDSEEEFEHDYTETFVAQSAHTTGVIPGQDVISQTQRDMTTCWAKLHIALYARENGLSTTYGEMLDFYNQIWEKFGDFGMADEELMDLLDDIAHDPIYALNPHPTDRTKNHISLSDSYLLNIANREIGFRAQMAKTIKPYRTREQEQEAKFEEELFNLNVFSSRAAHLVRFIIDHTVKMTEFFDPLDITTHESIFEMLNCYNQQFEPDFKVVSANFFFMCLDFCITHNKIKAFKITDDPSTTIFIGYDWQPYIAQSGLKNKRFVVKTDDQHPIVFINNNGRYDLARESVPRYTRWILGVNHLGQSPPPIKKKKTPGRFVAQSNLNEDALVNTEQRENTAFEEDVIPQTAVERSDMHLWRSPNPYGKHGVEDALTRLYKIDSQVWSGATIPGTVIEVYYSPSDILTAYQKNILSNFKYFRASTRFIISINTTQFHCGQLAILWTKGNASLKKGSGIPAENLHMLSYVKHAILSACNKDKIEIEVPFACGIEWLDIQKCLDDVAYMNSNAAVFGSLAFMVLQPLELLGSTTTPTVEISVHAQFVKPEVAGILFTGLTAFENRTKGGFIAQMRRERDAKQSSHKISGTVDAMSKFAGVMTTMPYVGGLASIAAPTLQSLSKLLIHFGYSKPTSNEAETKMIPSNGSSLSNGDGFEQNRRIILDPSGELASSPYFFDDEDYDSVIKFIMRPGFLYRGSFAASLGEDVVLVGFPVHPESCYVVNTGTSTRNFMTPLGLMSSMHRSWRGSMKYLLNFCCSPQVTCRIMITWLPVKNFNEANAVTNIPSEETGNVITKIVDISGDTQVTFSVPYLSPNQYSYNEQPGRQPGSLNANTEINGAWYLSFVNVPITYETEAEAAIKLSVFVAAGEDFSLAMPQNGTATPLWMQVYDPPTLSKEFKAQSARVRSNFTMEVFTQTFEPLMPATIAMKKGVAYACVSSRWSQIASRFHQKFTTNAAVVTHAYYLDWNAMLDGTGSNFWIIFNKTWQYYRGSLRYKLLNPEEASATTKTVVSVQPPWRNKAFAYDNLDDLDCGVEIYDQQNAVYPEFEIPFGDERGVWNKGELYKPRYNVALVRRSNSVTTKKVTTAVAIADDFCFGYLYSLPYYEFALTDPKKEAKEEHDQEVRTIVADFSQLVKQQKQEMKEPKEIVKKTGFIAQSGKSVPAPQIVSPKRQMILEVIRDLYSVTKAKITGAWEGFKAQVARLKNFIATKTKDYTTGMFKFISFKKLRDIRVHRYYPRRPARNARRFYMVSPDLTDDDVDASNISEYMEQKLGKAKEQTLTDTEMDEFTNVKVEEIDMLIEKRKENSTFVQPKKKKADPKLMEEARERWIKWWEETNKNLSNPAPEYAVHADPYEMLYLPSGERAYKAQFGKQYIASWAKYFHYAGIMIAKLDKMTNDAAKAAARKATALLNYLKQLVKAHFLTLETTRDDMEVRVRAPNGTEAQEVALEGMDLTIQNTLVANNTRSAKLLIKICWSLYFTINTAIVAYVAPHELPRYLLNYLAYWGVNCLAATNTWLGAAGWVVFLIKSGVAYTLTPLQLFIVVGSTFYNMMQTRDALNFSRFTEPRLNLRNIIRGKLRLPRALLRAAEVSSLSQCLFGPIIAQMATLGHLVSIGRL